VTCESCNQERTSLKAAVVRGRYYTGICQYCLNAENPGFTHSNANFERRHDYDDNASDAVQPYDAKGPNPEFYRLYPDKAPKIFTPDEIAEVKRKL
jgi:hypothetical protein